MDITVNKPPSPKSTLLRARSGTLSIRALKYFALEEKAGKIQCNLCKKLVSNSKTFNLVSHLKSVHKEVYDEIDKSAKPRTDTYFLIKRLKMLQNCTEIVALNGYSFSYIYCSGYQKTIHDQIQELEKICHRFEKQETNRIEKIYF